MDVACLSMTSLPPVRTTRPATALPAAAFIGRHSTNAALYGTLYLLLTTVLCDTALLAMVNMFCILPRLPPYTFALLSLFALYDLCNKMWWREGRRLPHTHTPHCLTLFCHLCEPVFCAVLLHGQRVSVPSSVGWDVTGYCVVGDMGGTIIR
jgi:hypothetical protein